MASLTVSPGPPGFFEYHSESVVPDTDAKVTALPGALPMGSESESEAGLGRGRRVPGRWSRRSQCLPQSPRARRPAAGVPAETRQCGGGAPLPRRSRQQASPCTRTRIRRRSAGAVPPAWARYARRRRRAAPRSHWRVWGDPSPPARAALLLIVSL